MRAAAALILLVSVLPARAFSQERAPWGTGQSHGEDLVVSLVTFTPGTALYEWWGHGALVVEDRRLGARRLYNYGMFDFHKFATFALGRLEFYVDEEPVVPVLRYYAEDKRGVEVQELNLSPDQRLQIAKALSDNVLPEHREYLYHHYLDNCATRLRDMIDRAVGGQLHDEARMPARYTLRGHTRRFTAVNPPMSVLLDLLMNDQIDRPLTRWDEAFLPSELEQLVARGTYKDAEGKVQPLVARTWSFSEASAPPPPAAPPNYGPAVLAIGFVVGLLALGLGAWASSGPTLARVLHGSLTALLGFVVGLPGLVLIFLWAFTDHTMGWHNENLLVCDPVALAALPGGVAIAFGSVKWRRRVRWAWLFTAATGVLGLLLKTIPFFDQDNLRILALFLPITLGLCAGALVYERGGVTALLRTRWPKNSPSSPKISASASRR